MTNTQSASSGCFSGITRLLLCRGSLQTHPADQTIGSSTTEFNQVEKDIKVNEARLQGRATPGVVARLMGLDSLPDTNWVPTGRTPDSVTRSRSVNFMDYLLELDLAQAQHRRVRTSVSFREVPVIFDKQNHDFLVVYMDDAEESKKAGSKVRKSEASPGEMKLKMKEKNVGENEDNRRREAKEEKCQQKDDRRKVSANKQFSRFRSCEGAAQVSPSNSASSPKIKKDVCRKSGKTSKKRISRVKPVDQKEALVESKFMKKMRNRRAMRDAESDSSSEVSDAVSVLSLSDISLHDENSLHDDAKSPEKSSTKTANMGCPASLPRSILNFDDFRRMGSKEKDSGSFGNPEREFYTELVRNLCRLADEDIKESNWIVMNAFQLDCFQDISADFGQQILDLLLCQVIEELTQVH